MTDNSDIEKKILSDDWKYAFIHILIDAYKKLDHNKPIEEPEEIKNNYKRFIYHNNPVLQWIDKHYEPNSSSKIRESVLFNSFRNDTDNKEVSQSYFSTLMEDSDYKKVKSQSVFKYAGLKRKSGH